MMKKISERLERMQQEVDQLRQDVAKSSKWLQPDTLVHMSGYADVGYIESESQEGSSMPPRGGNSQLSDDDLNAALKHIKKLPK